MSEPFLSWFTEESLTERVQLVLGKDVVRVYHLNRDIEAKFYCGNKSRDRLSVASKLYPVLNTPTLSKACWN